MKSTEEKREWEKRVVAQMIGIYCRKHHRAAWRQGKRLCPECEALKVYTWERSDHCPFMETKTFCSNCRVHCYKPEMRERIRQVMRFAGPRMLLYDPVNALRHLVLSRREKAGLAEEGAKTAQKQTDREA